MFRGFCGSSCGDGDDSNDNGCARDIGVGVDGYSSARSGCG